MRSKRKVVVELIRSGNIHNLRIIKERRTI